MSQRSCDVLVVGAGPAGATTALFAARAGLDVVLVDKRRFPRDKICGDAVARKSLSILDELGLLERVRACSHEPIGRAVLSSPRGHEVAIDLSSKEEAAPHLVCRREIFDHALVEAAREQLLVIEGAAVVDVTRENGRVTGATYRADGHEHAIRARVVVGADGFDSVVARRLGHYRHDSSRWFVATRGYYRGLEVEPNTVEARFFGDTLPGFLWVFPTGDGVANVGLGLVHRDLKRKGVRLRDVHEAVLSSPRLRDRFRRAERIGEVHGWNLPTPDTRRVIAGDGFLLVGDAAGLVDPFSGEGIGNALVSAKVAASVIADGVRTGDMATALARHGRLIDFLVGRAAAHTDVVGWLTGMTAARDSVSRKRDLLSPLTYARLLMKR